MFSQWTHPIHPIGPQTHLLLRFVVFGSISDRSVALRYSVENGPNYCNKCKSSCHKVALEFFATNPPYPLHVLVHFIVFGCTWDHFVTASNSVQNGLKWPLIQKFVPRSRVRCFQNERTQSTPHWTLNSSIVVFHSVWDHFVTAWNSVQNELKWCN